LNSKTVHFFYMEVENNAVWPKGLKKL